MAKVRLFAALREAAGVGEDEIDASTVGELLAEAERRYGTEFSDALPFCRVMVNGVGVGRREGKETPLGGQDEVALLPPVSGGAVITPGEDGTGRR